MLSVQRIRAFSKIVPGIAAFAVFMGVVPAFAQEVPGCGSLANQEGPWDYNDPSNQRTLSLVDRAHFTPEVAALQRGHTASIIQDLDYTLRAFPNYHQALQAVGRYALSGGGLLPDRPAECYFKRAVTFRPDDAAVHTIYGNFLLKCARLTDVKRRRRLQCGGVDDPEYMDSRVLGPARAQYEEALRLEPESPDINYDAGIFYVDVGELATARRLAGVAYGRGYPLQGLRRMIEAAEAHGQNPENGTLRESHNPGH